MLIVSILTFFVVIFLLASITVTVAWMGFLKRKVEEVDAARRDVLSRDLSSAESADPDAVDARTESAAPGAVSLDVDEDSHLFRNERLSTLNFWDTLLARFDFIEILRTRMAQAELDWSVGRVTLTMLLS